VNSQKVNFKKKKNNKENKTRDPSLLTGAPQKKRKTETEKREKETRNFKERENKRRKEKTIKD
jgi:hypothetical protein